MGIHRLSEEVIRKIAAGEVVERPASVAKELVENSLDAEAQQVRVDVEGGGLVLLRVSDDGHGMSPDDLRLAIERHTTSKLRTEEDLRHIRTLGFRGEALASICAVAQVRLVSRARGADEGHELEVHGGQRVLDRPRGRAVGTTVEVRNLFFNVPARRQFLDSATGEARHVLGVLRRLVLAHPEVAFAVSSERRKTLDVAQAKDPAERIAQIYGRDLTGRLMYAEVQEPGLHLRAWFGPPELSRPTRVDQHLFLSGRPVRLGSLGVAIHQVYARWLPRGQYPIFFLYLDADPQVVDVNVHPRKEELRFRAEGAVMDLLRRAALRALGTRLTAIPPLVVHGAPPVQPEPRPSSPQPAPPLWPERVPSHRPWRVLGQVHSSFILVEGEEGLEIVDQHAAHERVLFERYRDGMGVPSQELLVPVQIEVPFDRAEALRRALPDLAQIGVLLEPFGERAFLLRGWPAPLADRQSRLGFLEPVAAVAERLLEGEPPLRELWREVACAAAITAGETLSPAEQEALIERWKATQEPARCPHGRPVVLRLPWDRLAHELGR